MYPEFSSFIQELHQTTRRQLVDLPISSLWDLIQRLEVMIDKVIEPDAHDKQKRALTASYGQKPLELASVAHSTQLSA